MSRNNLCRDGGIGGGRGAAIKTHGNGHLTIIPVVVLSLVWPSKTQNLFTLL